mmetsp:Transcript_863/g.2076  ORF Transcript_863/g.2076 Transcript_863/m.2076 type:complete len:726 (-) Transcript_863:2569-4746(-)
MEFASDFAYLSQESELDSIPEADFEASRFDPSELNVIQPSPAVEEFKTPSLKESDSKKAKKSPQKKLPTFKAPAKKAVKPDAHLNISPQPIPPHKPQRVSEIISSFSSKQERSERVRSQALISPPAAPTQLISPPMKRGAPIPLPHKIQRLPSKRSVPLPRVDTNVVNIRLDVLENDSELATGDPYFCSKCRALLNSHSILARTPESYLWACEFCGEQNQLMIDEEEIPKLDELNYILEDPQDAIDSEDDSTIIFCIDISGSMGVTKPASGRIKLKTNKHEELLKLLQPDELDQFLPGQNRNLTYISRLECVQAAIDAQLSAMQSKMPTRKVGLVVFNREVRIIGDGLNEEVVAGDKLDNYEQCWNLVQGRLNHFIGTSVADSLQTLSTKLFALEENGPTALGPALLVSVGLACQGKPGSKVIICTDGLANVGLGAFESSDLEAVQSFYEQLGEKAKEHGVSVSVVSIEGEECRLEELSIMVDATEGDVTMVDPEHLAENFSNILSDKLIATHASATVTMHKALTFRNAETGTVSMNGSQLTKTIGNVNTTTTFSFEYQMKSKVELADIDLSEVASLPFQVAIYYTKPSGQKCIRSITKLKAKTTDRRQAEASSNFNVMATHAQQVSAHLAQKGQWEKAQSSISSWNSALARNVRNEHDNAVFMNAASNMMMLSSALSEQQMEEADVGMHIDEASMDVEFVKRSRAHKMKDKTVSTINKLKKRNS